MTKALVTNGAVQSKAAKTASTAFLFPMTNFVVSVRLNSHHHHHIDQVKAFLRRQEANASKSQLPECPPLGPLCARGICHYGFCQGLEEFSWLIDNRRSLELIQLKQ